MHASSASSNEYFADFPSSLRYWRDKRGYSQLQLSAIGDVSQRHLSFLESGRSQPSKELILKLGVALDIPLRQRNVMLLAAGFAPAYQERQLSNPEMASVRSAINFMLEQQKPYPAIVVDRLWNLQMHNEPAANLMRWLLGMPDGTPIPGDGAINVIKLMLDPNGMRQFIVNWKETAADLMHWIQREAMSDGPGSEASKLLAEMAEMCGMAAGPQAPNLERQVLPFLPVSVSKDGVELNLFTTIATLGTPRDVTLHELRIESFFPADEGTAQWFRELA